MRTQRSCVLSACLLALAACEVNVVNDDAKPDSGSNKPDAATNSPDSGAKKPDGGADHEDAGEPVPSKPTPLDCSDRGNKPTTTITGDISADTTWSGVVMLQGEVDVQSAVTLTIKPGTLVLMDADSSLVVGWNGVAARISAEGTAQAPIRFCGRKAEAGYYKQVSIESNVKTDSVFSHVLVADGGGSGSAALAIRAGIMLSDVRVEGSASDGVEASTFKRGSSRLSVKNAGKYAVTLRDAAAVHNFPLGGAIEANHDNVIRLELDRIDADTTFANAGVPYRQMHKVDISGGEIHIAAGVEYQMAADAELDVGWNGTTPSFFVDGTKEKPVLMRGVQATSGYWKRLQLEGGVRTESKLHYLQLQHAGANGTSALELNASVQLDHVTLDKNATAAKIHTQLGAGSNALTITGSAAQPLEISADAAISLPSDAKLSGNHTDYIDIFGTSYMASGTLRHLDVPYRVTQSIDFMADSSITIEAGTELVMTADVELEFGWNGGSMTVVAKGTADKPIIFRGDQDVAGYWKGILVQGNVRTGSAFDYVKIMNAGQASGAAITFEANVPLTHSTIEKSASHAVKAAMSLVQDYTLTNTFTNISLDDILKF